MTKMPVPQLTLETATRYDRYEGHSHTYLDRNGRPSYRMTDPVTVIRGLINTTGMLGYNPILRIEMVMRLPAEPVIFMMMG